MQHWRKQCPAQPPEPPRHNGNMQPGNGQQVSPASELKGTPERRRQPGTVTNNQRRQYRFAEGRARHRCRHLRGQRLPPGIHATMIGDYRNTLELATGIHPGGQIGTGTVRTKPVIHATRHLQLCIQSHPVTRAQQHRRRVAIEYHLVRAGPCLTAPHRQMDLLANLPAAEAKFTASNRNIPHLPLQAEHRPVLLCRQALCQSLVQLPNAETVAQHQPDEPQGTVTPYPHRRHGRQHQQRP